MTDPALPPGWVAAARDAAAELGLGTDLSGMGAEPWGRICRRVAQAMAGRGEAPPPGWEAALARQAGRADPDELARDEADAVLAARGEVFGIEDDA